MLIRTINIIMDHCYNGNPKLSPVIQGVSEIYFIIK